MMQQKKLIKQFDKRIFLTIKQAQVSKKEEMITAKESKKTIDQGQMKKRGDS